MAKVNTARVLQGTLAAFGIAFFVMLVGDVDFASLPDGAFSELPTLLVGILLLLVLNYTLDTASWWLVCDQKRPSIFRLTLIRLRAEAITNILPGGAVIGEPMKIGFLVSESKMSRVEATTSFLLGKFVLIFGQSIYVLVGLALAYEVIDSASTEFFGVEHVGVLVLVGALGILLLLVSLVLSMVFLQPMNRRFRISNQGGWFAVHWNRLLHELREVENLVAIEFRRTPFRFFVGIFLSFLSWSLNGVELYLIGSWLGIEATLITYLAIDAVSVVVRMVVFVIPIGMGGQDWAIAGLVGAFNIGEPTQTAARLVLLKRSREFAVIAVGLILLLLSPVNLIGAKNDKD